MGQSRGAGGQEEQSGQDSCGDLHGAARPRGWRAGLELGLWGSPLQAAASPGPCPAFMPSRWAGAGFHRIPRERIIPGKSRQEESDLLS